MLNTLHMTNPSNTEVVVVVVVLSSKIEVVVKLK